MASTTKIMTALVLLEKENLDNILTVTKEMYMVEGTSIGLREGDKISYRNLLYGMMLESGNDAANAIAIGVGRNINSFADLMNQKAAQIGMNNSHFVTPSGLDADEHYTTAYDMALLAAAAMENETFRQVVSTEVYKSIYNDGVTTRTYYNHNRLIRELEGCEGIKTGYTSKSGRCLVTSCSRGGVRLIAVTLNAPDDWRDHKALYEYGFSDITEMPLHTDLSGRKIPIAGGQKKYSTLYSDGAAFKLPSGASPDIKTVITLPPFLYAPINAGDTVGEIKYYIGKKQIACEPVYLKESVKIKRYKKISRLTQWKNWFIILLTLK
jgi:D-alanyl-D-alanine carboxypeptidase (penicillin-binding protein 5/6)